MSSVSAGRVPAEDLTRLAFAAFSSVGLPRDDAALVADTLVTSDLAGHASHGLYRLRWYVDRIRAGVMRSVTDITSVVDAGAVAVLDGNDGVGQVVTYHATREAISRAAHHGVGVVGVRRSNHFGRAAYFTLLAPAQGCIGILTTNASPALAPWGGRKAVVGNNPWSIAAPAGKYAPVVMDMANTVVARGKIYVARRLGQPIPDHWAFDSEGRPTTDPEAALAGLLQPMAGYKGYAIAFMMDVLSGVLTGAEFATGVAGPYQSERRSGAGHLCIALDVGRFIPPTEFGSRMERLIEEIRSAPPSPGADRVYYPGEPEHLALERNQREGVHIDENTRADLRRLAAELDLEPPF